MLTLFLAGLRVQERSWEQDCVYCQFRFSEIGLGWNLGHQREVHAPNLWHVCKNSPRSKLGWCWPSVSQIGAHGSWQCWRDYVGDSLEEQHHPNGPVMFLWARRAERERLEHSDSQTCCFWVALSRELHQIGWLELCFYRLGDGCVWVSTARA